MAKFYWKETALSDTSKLIILQRFNNEYVKPYKRPQQYSYHRKNRGNYKCNEYQHRVNYKPYYRDKYSHKT